MYFNIVSPNRQSFSLFKMAPMVYINNFLINFQPGRFIDKNGKFNFVNSSSIWPLVLIYKNIDVLSAPTLDTNE